ncbi:36579_t:CDS:2, partial [Gigaspora margarita]
MDEEGLNKSDQKMIVKDKSKRNEKNSEGKLEVVLSSEAQIDDNLKFSKVPQELLTICDNLLQAEINNQKEIEVEIKDHKYEIAENKNEETLEPSLCNQIRIGAKKDKTDISKYQEAHVIDYVEEIYFKKDEIRFEKDKLPALE